MGTCKNFCMNPWCLNSDIRSSMFIELDFISCVCCLCYSLMFALYTWLMPPCNRLQNATSFLGISTNANPSYRKWLNNSIPSDIGSWLNLYVQWFLERCWTMLNTGYMIIKAVILVSPTILLWLKVLARWGSTKLWDSCLLPPPPAPQLHLVERLPSLFYLLIFFSRKFHFTWKTNGWIVSYLFVLLLLHV